jgi:creatinine amidohydrolase
VPSLGDQVWPEVAARATLLVPLGATEQHGPHLPFDTDTRLAVAIAARASELTGAVVAPALPYGSSGEHAGFPGTLSIGADALRHVVIELVRSARLTFGKVVFVNGHGGNHGPVTDAVDQMRSEGHDVVAWWPSIPGGDAHAGRTETSLMLAIAPESVRLERAEAGNPAPLSELLPVLRAEGVAAASPNGVLGDPQGAAAAEGERLLDQLAAQLARTIDSG